jgi:exosortase/archaeosortase family protein
MALPLPGFILTGLTLPLQTIAAKIATVCLRVIGISVVRKGNILELPNGALGVAEACSGIRSITVLFAVVLAVIFFNRLRKVPAIILLLAVPPVAIAANGIRVIVSGILYYKGLKDLASGGPHELLGLLTFGLGIAILLGLAGLLTSLQLKASRQPANVGGGVPTANVPQNVGGTPNKSGRRSPSGDLAGGPQPGRCPNVGGALRAAMVPPHGCEGHTTGKPPGTGCVNTSRGSESQSSATPSLQTILASLDISGSRAIAVIVILLLGAATSHVVASHYDAMFRRELQAMGDRKSLETFPERVGPYRRVNISDLSDEEFDMLRPTDRLLATYVGPDGRLFPITLLYWKPPRSEPSNRPDLLQRPHTPDECYPAAGWKRDWEFDSDREYAWLPGELGSIRLYHRNGESQLLLFWLGLTFKRTLSPDQLLSRLKSMIQSWNYAPAANIHTITIMTDATGDPETARKEALEFSRTLAEILPDYGIGRRTNDE